MIKYVEHGNGPRVDRMEVGIHVRITACAHLQVERDGTIKGIWPTSLCKRLAHYDDPVLVLLQCIGHRGAKHPERVQGPCLMMQALVCGTNLWPFAAIPHSCTFVHSYYEHWGVWQLIFVLLRLEKNMGNAINLELNNIHYAKDSFPELLFRSQFNE